MYASTLKDIGWDAQSCSLSDTRASEVPSRAAGNRGGVLKSPVSEVGGLGFRVYIEVGP